MKTTVATTTMGALGAAQVGQVLGWLLDVGHLPVPPDGVATTIGAGLVIVVHLAADAVRRRAATNQGESVD